MTSNALAAHTQIAASRPLIVDRVSTSNGAGLMGRPNQNRRNVSDSIPRSSS